MIPKFRAWHTPFKGKKFGQEMKYGRAGTLLSFAEMSPDDYILMQSTGLRYSTQKSTLGSIWKRPK